MPLAAEPTPTPYTSAPSTQAITVARCSRQASANGERSEERAACRPGLVASSPES